MVWVSHTLIAMVTAEIEARAEAVDIIFRSVRKNAK
jgi:hypothetical protein